MPPTISPRPRTIFVNRFFYPDHSATAQILSDLAFHLAAQGENVAIITSRLVYDDRRVRLPAREQVRGVDVYRVATTGFGRATFIGRAVDLALFYVSAGLALVRLAKARDVIVAKTDPPLLSLMAHAAGTLRGAHLINWLQDVYPEVASALGVRALDGRVGKLIAAWRNATLRAAHMNVVLGERMGRHLCGQGVAPHQVAVIANWSDEREITPLAHQANPLRTAWGLQDKFVVGYSGNLGRAHEFETMLGAARALRDDPSIVFLMIGGGHFSGPLKAAVDADRLTNVIFKPYQPLAALSQSLCAADIHWVSLKPELEGFIVPSKVYGILAAGRPVIAVTEAEGEVARVLIDHGCGVQVTPGDHHALAAVVRALANDPPRTSALGEAARAAAVGLHSRANALLKWRMVLANVDASSRPVDG